MNILEKIEQLRSKGVSPDEIERLLLSEKLGKIWIYSTGYQYAENIQLSWLVVEAHEPGHVEWMRKHLGEYNVHHVDGDKLNNAYSNLQVMSQTEHIRIHHTDPRFTETERIRYEKISAWYKDPVNVKANEARSKAISETRRKNNGWITPESDPEFFENSFTVRDYAIASNISLTTATYRLTMLLYEGQITCEKKLIDGSWRNVYRR